MGSTCLVDIVENDDIDPARIGFTMANDTIAMETVIVAMKNVSCHE